MYTRSWIIPKIITASSIGSLIEWYDFFIAGAAAASVWPLVFFPSSNPVAALIFSISSFAVLYFTRPVAAYIFGHLGDKIGRKFSLYWTLILTSIGMFGIAATPSYAVIGISSSILLFIFRLIQGLGVGGEWQGGIVWVAEFVINKKFKGFYTALVQIANSFGIALGTVTFYIVGLFVRGPDFLSWGWRIPFIIGGLVAIVGVIIRYRLLESPLFEEINIKGQIEKLPAAKVWKENWYNIILFAIVTSFVIVTENLNMNPIGISYMTAKGIPLTVPLIAISVGAALSALFLLLGAVLSDMFGRKPVLLISTFLTAVWIYPFYFLVNTLYFVNILLACILLFAFSYIGYGILPIAFSENFETKYRYSGVGWSFQLGALIAGSILTVVVPYAFSISGGIIKAWNYLALISVLITILAFISGIFYKQKKPKE